ncbi:MAG: V-type proton ATPase subunit E [Proteobacteria bacterium]|nr:V-type proton ATPase subunit E [Pseudomonadota bacterium]
MNTLFEHLRGVGEEKVKTIWQQSEAEVHDYQQEKEAALAEDRKRCQLQGQQTLVEFGRSLMVAAEEKAWLRQSEAETQLADRLYELAQRELPWLREQCGSRLLETCAKDLPRAEWKKLRVHESEVNLARTLFPGAEIAGDNSISGGFVAESADDRIMVINTLEKRLERSWPRILPELLRTLRKEKENAAS